MLLFKFEDKSSWGGSSVDEVLRVRLIDPGVAPGAPGGGGFPEVSEVLRGSPGPRTLFPRSEDKIGVEDSANERRLLSKKVF